MKNENKSVYFIFIIVVITSPVILNLCILFNLYIYFFEVMYYTGVPQKTQRYCLKDTF